MLRLILFLCCLLLAGIGLAALADMPGGVTIHLMGWQIETSLLFTFFVLGLLIIALFFVFGVLSAVVNFPRRFRRARYIDHHERGLSVLTEAFAALAISDIATAKKLTRRADSLLGSPPITHLLAAQLARLEGDGSEATAHLKPLLEHKETRFLAARGLLEQARKRGEMDVAIAYAEEAGHIRPDSTFAAISLIDLYTHEQRWQKAQAIINSARRHKALDKTEARRYLALVDYQHAQNLYAKEDYALAQRFAKAAHKTLPDMVPAALLLARCYHKLGQRRQIAGAIARTWKHAPHPSLALLLRKLYMDESPARRLKRVESLAATNPDDIESQIAVAEAALDDAQFDKARNHLKIALSKQETPRICKLMARLEEAQSKSKEKADEWLERAVKANIGPSWTCENCKAITEKWSLHCPECDGFDTISWQINRLNFVDASRRALPSHPAD
jgi:HemY protein